MIGQAKDIIKYLLDKEGIYEVKPHKEKRTNTQNNYLWSLYNKMAVVLKTSQDEVHLEMLKKYGKIAILPLLPSENPNGYFKYYDEKGLSKINGQEVKLYKVYKRSSEMNTLEFSHLIDGVISECKELDIETLPIEEIKRLERI